MNVATHYSSSFETLSYMTRFEFDDMLHPSMRYEDHFRSWSYMNKYMYTVYNVNIYIHRYIDYFIRTLAIYIKIGKSWKRFLSKAWNARVALYGWWVLDPGMGRVLLKKLPRDRGRGVIKSMWPNRATADFLPQNSKISTGRSKRHVVKVSNFDKWYYHYYQIISI